MHVRTATAVLAIFLASSALTPAAVVTGHRRHTRIATGGSVDHAWERWLESARASSLRVVRSPAPKARRELASLQVADRVNPRATYDRASFGSSWADTDGNGCNQRDDVLARDAVPGTLTTGWQGRCDHDVLAGSWVDPYTGRTIVLTDAKDRAQSMAVQIDHIVPLSESWVSGADGWNPDRRRSFANDLPELLAVDGPTNASKGDDDPAAWRPRKQFQCVYAKRWIRIKDRWDLSVDPSELRALREMLDFC